MPLHGGDDVQGALDQRQPGGLAVHAGAQRADNGVGAGDRAVGAAAFRAAADEGRPVNYGFAASWAAARMRLLDGEPDPHSGVFDFTAGMAGTR